MNTPNPFDIANIYEQSTIILGVESIVMALTLLSLRNTLKNSGPRSKSALIFLSIAMFALGVVNLVEYSIGIEIKNMQPSLSIVIFTASVELFLLFYTCMSMLCMGYITKRRVLLEIVYIGLFTVPVIFVSSADHPLWFSILFTIGIIFFGVKLLFNIFKYRESIKITRAKLENYFSDDCRGWLVWLNNTFYIVMSIGVVSIIVPRTNFTILLFFNFAIIIAFFYIYISVIRNISVFDNCMSILDCVDGDGHHQQRQLPLYMEQKLQQETISARQKLLDDWIKLRGYSVVGVTATQVAERLKTNRTKLSQYLKNDLNTNYYEWIAVLRIEDAKRQLLEFPDRAIYEVALNVGIEDSDNFRRVFQRHVGVSPTTFRRQNIEQI